MSVTRWLFEKRTPWKGETLPRIIFRVTVLLLCVVLLAYVAYIYFLA